MAVVAMLAAYGGAAALPAAEAAGGTGVASTIANGVTAGGVDLSGLTVAAAATKLQQALSWELNQDVIVGAGGRVFRLSARSAQERLDATATATLAAAATQPGVVPLSLTHSRPAVSAFVGRVARAIDRPARDARVRFTPQRLYRVADRPGLRLTTRPIVTQIDAALQAPGAGRLFHVKLVKTRARITKASLPGMYPTVITIDRVTFKLRLFKRLRLRHTWPVAVGMAGLATPAGIYQVQEREVNPSWHVPNAPWAGSLAGQTIPPGPGDPIVARWLGLGGGVGIHGTNEPWSIGSRASHGCIRMLPSDVIALYPQVPLGTPVYIR